MTTILQRMQQRRKTAAAWTSANEVLLNGELGFEQDTQKWKIGDGSTAWNSLAYQPSNAGISAAISAAVAGVVNSAPGALDTLNELAAALGNDSNYAATITTALAAKASTSSLAAVATSGSYTDLANRPILGTAAAQNTSAFDAAGAASTAQAYSIQRGNHTGTQDADTITDGTTNKAFTGTERTKLAGIATAATANSSDATLLARANHTGTQAASTITGLATVATSGLKADVGLGNVDNVADASKPVSTAQAAADAAAQLAAINAAAALSPYVPAALNWYMNPLAVNNRTLAMTLNNLYLHLFYSGTTAITLDKFDVNVSVAAGAGGLCRIGVYTITDQAKPFYWSTSTAWATLLSEVGTVATTSTGQQILTASSAVTIPANTWFAVGGAEQTAAATRYVAGLAGGVWATKLGSGNTTGAYNQPPGLSLYKSSTSGALPSSFTPTGITNSDSGVGIHRSA